MWRKQEYEGSHLEFRKHPQMAKTPKTQVNEQFPPHRHKVVYSVVATTQTEPVKCQIQVCVYDKSDQTLVGSAVGGFSTNKKTAEQSAARALMENTMASANKENVPPPSSRPEPVSDCATQIVRAYALAVSQQKNLSEEEIETLVANTKLRKRATPSLVRDVLEILVTTTKKG